MDCADYSKAFDTVQFKYVLTKMHNLGFSKEFLLWMVDYITDRRQMVQIDDRKSDMATVEFSVPKVPFLDQLFLISTSLIFKRNYSVTVIFYVHSKPGDLDSSAAQINKTITSLRDYSNNCNLALNPTKTNWILISTPQMARYHSLEERDLPIICGDSALKRISCTVLSYWASTWINTSHETHTWILSYVRHMGLYPFCGGSKTLRPSTSGNTSQRAQFSHT